MKLKITRVDRIEPLLERVVRFVKSGKAPSHWHVIGEIEGGSVDELNLLKFNNGLKLFVEEVRGNHVVLSTIKPTIEIGNISYFHVRMDHWKYGRGE